MPPNAICMSFADALSVPQLVHACSDILSADQEPGEWDRNCASLHFHSSHPHCAAAARHVLACPGFNLLRNPSLELVIKAQYRSVVILCRVTDNFRKYFVKVECLCAEKHDNCPNDHTFSCSKRHWKRTKLCFECIPDTSP